MATERKSNNCHCISPDNLFWTSPKGKYSTHIYNLSVVTTITKIRTHCYYLLSYQVIILKFTVHYEILTKTNLKIFYNGIVGQINSKEESLLFHNLCWKYFNSSLVKVLIPFWSIFKPFNLVHAPNQFSKSLVDLSLLR